MDSPDHEQMISEGWSFIELVGGPQDGTHAYFKGSPKWRLYFVDPAVDPLHYKAGDREHEYVLTEGPNGHAVYRWTGDFRRQSVAA